MLAYLLLAVLAAVGLVGIFAYIGGSPSLRPLTLTHLRYTLLSQIGAITPVVDAGSWADKMLERLKASGSAWEKGVANPSASPVAGMKKAKKKWATEMQAAIANDSWGKSIDQLTDEAIAAQALKVGGSALVAGVTAREDKIRAAIARLQPEVAALKAKIDALPIDTEQQRDDRALAAIRGMRAIGKKLAGLSR